MREPFLADPDVTLYQGDALEVLCELPAESVHCIATSPPFYALRDYGVEGQIGLEPTPEEWASRLVEVFREARRVLRKDGTLWVECGDSYASDSKWGGASGNKNYTSAAGGIDRSRRRTGHKDKDLLGTPWLLAFALRADGWWLRGCNIWAKPNAMPESAKDRCTTAHSYVFQLSKSARYHFDAEAIAETAAWERWGDQTVTKDHPEESAASWIKPRPKAELVALGGRTTNGQKERSVERRGFDNRLEREDGLKHPRSVWTIPTRGYPGAHFATWPIALAEKIILAGCPPAVCQECGKVRERIVEREFEPQPDVSAEKGIKGHAGQKPAAAESGWQGFPRGTTTAATVGFTDCGHGAYAPGVVLDPFAGSGTTLVVARRLRRRSVGIELSGDYCRFAEERLATWWKDPPQAQRDVNENQWALDPELLPS